MHPLELPAELERRFDQAGLAFLADFYEIALGEHPGNVEALAELGNVYTRLGRLEDGLAVDHRLVHLAPENPVVHYNLACSLALLERASDALDALECAIRLGYADVSFLEEDEDLASLRAQSRFQELVERLRSGA